MYFVLRVDDEDLEAGVDLGRAPSVQEMLDALGVRRGAVRIDGRSVDPCLSVVDAGLLRGSLVEVGGLPVGPSTGASWAASVVAGPDSGRSIALGPGNHVIGRSAVGTVVINDPTVSPVHAQLVIDDAGPAAGDLGSRNGMHVLATAVGVQIDVGASRLRIEPIVAQARRVAATSAGEGRLALHRPPRVVPATDEERIAVPSPERPPSAPMELNVAAVVVPLVLAGVLVLLLGDPRFALFALLSPLMALANWRGGRRRQRRAVRREEARLAVERAVFDEQLAAAAERAEARLCALHPDLANVVDAALSGTTELWAVRPGTEGWLACRLGTGEVAVDLAVEGSPDAEAKSMVGCRSVRREAPVVVDLGRGVVGIVGPRRGARALARAMLLQLVSTTGPADVRLAVATGGPILDSDDWRWVHWLPHLVSDDVAWTVGAATTVVVVDQASLLHGASPVAELLRRGEGAVTGIVLADREELLPAFCTTVIGLIDDVGTLELHRPDAGSRTVRVRGALAAVDVALTVGRRLARYVDPEASDDQMALPSEVALLDALGLPVDALTEAVAKRWERSNDALWFGAGVGAGGQRIEVDLVADGPHALVAGTTGSGKSELLRSMVLALAAGRSPADLVFVLVDYKGGSAFDACGALPHVVGVVTDLDEHLAARALQSLEAELTYREHFLRAAGAAGLAEYRAAGSPAGPLPRLVVMIDEFATLAAELPDFVGSLVGIAQRGRSLGVHLILATQRPQGAVSANIRANTNIRIALRVQSAAESSDVIDSPLAASLARSTPGRAYLRLGAGELTAAQTPYSGRPAATLGGRAVAWWLEEEAPVSVSAAADGETELGLLAGAIGMAWRARAGAAPRKPWLAMLAREVALDALPADESDDTLVLGLEDDPRGQAQRPWGWRPADGNLALVGMVGAGTSTAVATIVAAITRQMAVDAVHVYVLDAGGSLGALAALDHVGAVVGPNDDERQHRLVAVLWNEVLRRRDLAPEARAKEPLVVLIIDGLGPLLADHGGPEGAELVEVVRRLMIEGAAVGVVTVATMDRPSTLPPRVGGAFAQRVVFRLADPLDYAAAGLRTKDLPAFAPGRGVDLRSGHVVQIARGEPKRSVPDGGLGRRPRPINRMPTVVDLGILPPPTVGRHGWTVPVGVLDGDGTPAALLLRPGEHCVVAGPARSGVTSALALLASQARAADPSVAVVAIAGTGSTSVLDRVAAIDAVGEPEELASVLALVGAVPAQRWLILVDDAHRREDPGIAPEVLCLPNVVVVAGGRADELRSAFGHWTRALRRSRTGLLLAPRLDLDGDLLGVKLPRRLPVELRAGRGFVVEEGAARLVQLAHLRAL